MSPTVGLRKLMGGTLTASSVYRSVLDDRPAGDISTHCWVLKEQAFFPGKKYDPGVSPVIPVSIPLGLGCWCRDRFLSGVLFENCTVDASIFVSKC